jgi:dTMP kinase
MKRGLFILIEGTDGSGKTLQTKILVKRLKKLGKKVAEISFPRYGNKSSALVEDYLNGKFGSAREVGPYRASVFYAIDRYAASFDIKKWLAQGKIVVCNRYVGSNLAHQGGKIKNKSERKKYIAWNYNLEYNIFGIPKPDISLILHVTPRVSQELVDKKGAREYLHGKKRDIHEDDLRHLHDAEQAYLQIAKTFKEYKLIECVEKNKILLPEKIHKKIWHTIKSSISRLPRFARHCGQVNLKS